MRTKFIKYGKSVKKQDGTMEHMEISIELDRQDYEEEAISRAKMFCDHALHNKAVKVNFRQPLKATIGEQLAAKEKKNEDQSAQVPSKPEPSYAV